MKIGICGAQGTGKTTLLNNIIRDLPELENKENYSVAGKLKQAGIFRQIPTTLLQFMLMERHRYLLSLEDSLVTDRTVVDSFAYAVFERKINAIEENHLKFLMEEVENLLPLYDVIFYLPIEFKIENNGIRSTDYEFQKEIDSYIKMYSLTRANIIKLNGTIEERTSAALKVISKLKKK